MDLQAIADKVYLGLKSQDFEQCIFKGACRFTMTGPRGKKLRCAAGYLLPDDIVVKEEDQYVTVFNSLIPEFAEIKANGAALALVMELQRAHDEADNFNSFVNADGVEVYKVKARIEKAIKSFGLTIPE